MTSLEKEQSTGEVSYLMFAFKIIIKLPQLLERATYASAYSSSCCRVWRCLSLIQYVWCPHETEAYLPGRVQSRANGVATVELVFEDGHRERASVPEGSCTTIGSMVAVSNQVDDLVQLAEVNDPSIVHLLRARFMQDKIYTWVGNILVAVRICRYMRGCQMLSFVMPLQGTSPFNCL